MARCAQDAELAVEVLALLLEPCWTLYHAAAIDKPCSWMLSSPMAVCSC